jgi:hypothetical protein
MLSPFDSADGFGERLNITAKLLPQTAPRREKFCARGGLTIYAVSVLMQRRCRDLKFRVSTLEFRCAMVRLAMGLLESAG